MLLISLLSILTLSQHYTEEEKQKDLQRDKYMKGLGLKVLRFSDTDILDNLFGMAEKIGRAHV